MRNSIVLLHTVPKVASFITKIVAAEINDTNIVVNHVIAPHYLHDLSIENLDMEVLYSEFKTQVDSWILSNRAVLVTCSSLGPFVDLYNQQNNDAPLFRIDEPMMREIFGLGRNVGLVVSNETTIAPSIALIKRLANDFKIDVSVSILDCRKYTERLLTMKEETEVKCVNEELEKVFLQFDVIVVAQASVGQMFDEHNLHFNVPVLKSYRTGIKQALEWM